ncbi:ABC transporter ATP-binding protein/permease [Acidimicrobiaceae bacterium]|nr:ABC transporter ATP-binding protein/permease [Acidimicrobiaceae bacterium]
MNLIKKVINDVRYVSKLTGTHNKKIIIIKAVVVSQLTAFSDIIIILLFAAIITGSFDSENILRPFIEIVLDYKLLLPLIVFLRFAAIYYQSMLLKSLELNVRENINVFLLKEVFDKRNYSIADGFFYLNVLSGHISYFYSNLTNFINSTLQVFAFTIYLVISDIETVGTFGIGALLLYYPTKILLKKARSFMHESYEYNQQSNQEVQRVIENMFLIKLLKKDTEEINNYQKTFHEYSSTTLQNHKYGAINSFLPSFTTMFVFAILLTVSSIARSLTLDFIGVMFRLFQSFGGITNSANQILNSHVHMEKFSEMEKNKISVHKDNFINEQTSSEYAIKIEDLSFQYFNSDELIFEKINLEITKNTHTIITGPNGSGKSTLLGLMAGVFYSQKGKVYANNKKFGYIGATPMIFTGTLKDNLLYGNDQNIDENVIIQQLKDFQTFKEESNYRLDKVIDNKSLSSGQMQKIAFIRALLSEPDILLLDESTANLDDFSRKLIFKILGDKQVTIINSTHDPENFENVDNHLKIDIVDEKRILVLN